MMSNESLIMISYLTSIGDIAYDASRVFGGTTRGIRMPVFAGNVGHAVHTCSLFLGIKRYHGQFEG